MKYLKSLGLAVLAALSVMAVMGAGMASASEPVVDATSFPVSFTGAGGHGLLEVTNGNKVTCTGSTSSGNIVSTTTAENVVVKFTGCTASFGAGCQSSGAAAGEIVTKKLHGTLVYLETNSTKTGILLKGEGASKTFATFTCAGGLASLEVVGEVIAELTSPNVKTKTFTLHFYSAGGHPTPASYLSNVGCTHVSTTEALKTKSSGFPSFGLTGSAVQGTQTLTTSQEITVTATSCV